jgi:acyl-CoA thioesterase-1
MGNARAFVGNCEQPGSEARASFTVRPPRDFLRPAGGAGPCLYETTPMFRSLALALIAACAAVSTAGAQIVAFGASSTAGYGVGASAAFPALLEELLRARGRPMSVINAGVSGDTTGGMLARLSSAVPPGTRIVILQIAGNDIYKGLSETEAAANRAEIRRRLHARGIRTIEADDLVLAARRAGHQQPDGIHMTAEGHRRVAAQLAASIR